MKIEKLTENKIRVVVDSSDFKLDNLSLNRLTTTSLEQQTFFIKLLEKAKKEIGFETDGCKLLIETFSSSDEFIVFTITKYSSLEKKKPVVKRKLPRIYDNNSIFKFDTFNEFCEFCDCISKINNLNIKNLSNNINLYFYKNTYYLLLKNINSSYKQTKMIYSLLSEFSKPVAFSQIFENKLIEYGSLIIKKNAVEKGIKFFI